MDAGPRHEATRDEVVHLLVESGGDARIVAGHQGDEPSHDTEFAKKRFALVAASGKPLAAWHHEEIVAAMVKDKPAGTRRLPNDISPNAAFSFLTTVEDYSLFLAHVASPRKEDVSPAIRGQISTPISRINSARMGPRLRN